MSDIEVIDEKLVQLKIKVTVRLPPAGQSGLLGYASNSYTTTVTKHITREDAKKLADDLYKACKG